MLYSLNSLAAGDELFLAAANASSAVEMRSLLINPFI
jgi:hypothetical protein